MWRPFSLFLHYIWWHYFRTKHYFEDKIDIVLIVVEISSHCTLCNIEEVDNLKDLSSGDFSYLGLVGMRQLALFTITIAKTQAPVTFQFWELYEAWHNMIHCRHFPIQLLHNQQQAPLIDLIILLGYLPLSVRWVSDSFRFWRQLHIASTKFASL